MKAPYVYTFQCALQLLLEQARIGIGSGRASPTVHLGRYAPQVRLARPWGSHRRLSLSYGRLMGSSCNSVVVVVVVVTGLQAGETADAINRRHREAVVTGVVVWMREEYHPS